MPPRQKQQQPQNPDVWRQMRKDLLWTEAKDVWYLFLDPVWADFHGTPSADNRPVPLVDAFPLNLWLYKEPDDLPEEKRMAAQGDRPPAKMHILGETGGLVSAQLNHYQLLFLLRAVETVSEITTFLTEDVKHILGEGADGQEEEEDSIAVGVMAPQVDLSLLMPSVAQSKEFDGSSSSLAAAAASATPGAGDGASVYSAGDELAAAMAAVADATSGTASASNTLAALPTTHTTSASPMPHLPSEEDSPLASPVKPSPSPVPSTSSSSSRPVPSINLQGPPPPPPSQSSSSASLAGPSSATSTPSKPRPISASAQAKKNSLTTSMTNMMASLGGGGKSPSGDDDEVSVRSDGSSDSSESYVMITQNAAALEAASARESFDNALFNIQTGQHVGSLGAVPHGGGAVAR